MKKAILRTMILSLIPFSLLSCSGNAITAALKYEPVALTRDYELSDTSKNIYMNFASKVTKSFFSLHKEAESMALSLPDLYFCYAMMANISGPTIQKEFLDYVGASSLTELKESSFELASYLIFTQEAEENEGGDFGSFNLNGFFYDPAYKYLEGHEQYLEEFSEYFNAYSFSSKPTTGLIEEWFAESDPEGYLSEVETPSLPNDAILATVSSYAVIDSFDKDKQDRYEKVYKEGGNRLDYTLENGESLMPDAVSLSGRNNVTFYDDYQLLRAAINKTGMTIYYPNEGVDNDQFATTIFDAREGETKSYTHVSVNVPMFDIDTSISEVAASLVPSFAYEEEVASLFLDKANIGETLCFLVQNNALTFDYHGFKGASKTALYDAPTASEDNPTYYNLSLERPFVFSITYGELPIYYGKIHDPGYPKA